MHKEIKVEFIKGVLSTADSLIKSAFILNGASAAGLLTFVGNTIDKKAGFHNWQGFGNSLNVFAIGLFFVLLANLAKMLTLNFAAQVRAYVDLQTQDDLKINMSVENRLVAYAFITFGLFCASGVCFIAGVVLGKRAIFG